MRITALATPGHTFTHLSYALAEVGAGAEAEQVGVFSGGSLLFGATGRPDLLGADHTDALVRHQHASAHRLAEILPDDAGVFPTHGFGSFCSATQSDASESTIGREKQVNPVLTQDEETYVRELLDGPRRLAGLLRPHGAGQRRRPRSPRPDPARTWPRPTSCAGASRPASGSSTCATGPRSRPATRPAR